jgi:hypothetical protein
LAESTPDISVFVFALNNPVSFNDPTGLAPSGLFPLAAFADYENERKKAGMLTAEDRGNGGEIERNKATLYLYSGKDKNGSLNYTYAELKEIGKVTTSIFQRNGINLFVIVTDEAAVVSKPLKRGIAYLKVEKIITEGTIRANRTGEGEGQSQGPNEVHYYMNYPNGGNYIFPYKLYAANGKIDKVAVYKTGHLAAHETLHQLLEEARAFYNIGEWRQFYYKSDLIRSGKSIPLHVNNPINLNTDAQYAGMSVANYVGTLLPVETILPDHKVLILKFLNAVSK